jgi:hypothetical protein
LLTTSTTSREGRSIVRMAIASDSRGAAAPDGRTSGTRGPCPKRAWTTSRQQGPGHGSPLILSREDVIHGKDPQMVAANCSLLAAIEMNDESARVVSRRLDHANDLPSPQPVPFDSGERMAVQWTGKRPIDPGGQQFESTIAAAQRSPSSCWSGPSPTDNIRSTDVALWGARGLSLVRPSGTSSLSSLRRALE